MKTKNIILSLTAVAAVVLLICTLTPGYEKKHNVYGSTSIGNGGLMYEYGNRIYNPKTGKTLVKDIEWIYETDDSIGVIAQKGRRGFINLNTAQMIVPTEYYKGWVFASNRGCLSRNDTLFIFNRKGELQGTFRYKNEYECLFYKDHLVVHNWDNNLVGLIDTACQWTLPAEFLEINYEYGNQGFWNTKKKDFCMLLNLDLDTIISGDYAELDVDWSEGIIATEHNGVQHLYNYRGEMLYEQIFGDIQVARYDTGKRDRDGNPVMEEMNCYIYSNYNGKKGLMNRFYHPITAPLFYDIEARGQHIFFASFGDWTQRFGTLIDDQGKTIH